VRELENILERAAAFANDACIDVIDLALRNSGRIAPATDHSPVPVTSQESAHTDRSQEVSANNPQNLLADSNVHPVFDAPCLPCSLPAYLEEVEREVIRQALKMTRNNRTQAAELLGVSFRQLRYSIQKLKITDVE
jgi:two-component system response regulator PilR (NtrC family)